MTTHTKLFIPGPVEVSEKTFRAFGSPMIGHRGKDFAALYAQIQGALAKQGDQQAAIWVRDHAQTAGSSRDTLASRSCANSDDDDDPRVAALNALLQMDAESAMPILKQVLARRDACSVQLRRKAVFIISQKRTAETEDILLAAARTIPMVKCASRRCSGSRRWGPSGQ